MESAFPEGIESKPNIISLREEDVKPFYISFLYSQEENKENVMQNSLNNNYPLKNFKDKGKKVIYNKFEDKGLKKRKDNRQRKKLALLGLNKPNSTRNPQFLN